MYIIYNNSIIILIYNNSVIILIYNNSMIIPFFFRTLTSHPHSGHAAFGRQNFDAMQQLAKKGTSSEQAFSPTAIQQTPDFPSTKRLMQW